MSETTPVSPEDSLTRYRAFVKSEGRTIATKIFKQKSLASAWARRIESDRDLMSALGSSIGVQPLKEFGKL